MPLTEKIERVVSGMRPSGKLHLGNLFGALKTWVTLQDQYECLFLIADLHTLTTDYEKVGEIKENVYEMLIDWLSAGINPEKSSIFLQSEILEHSELHLLLSMITPLSWLERNPTYKEQQQEISHKDLSTYGFLGYPVLQAADILIYKAQRVPIGLDQLPHLELAREIARRFNFLYGEIFFPPQPILSESPKILGLDGRKMSKAYDNAIFLSDPEEKIKTKARMMITDPQRKRRLDPGDPGVCSVFGLHQLFSLKQELAEIAKECPVAGIGCVDCKSLLIERIGQALKPIREKRTFYAQNPSRLKEILDQGKEKAKRIASDTMNEVRKAMGLT